MTRAYTKRVTVAEIAAATRNSLVGGPFGSNLVSADYVDQGVPVIRGQNMGHGRWVNGDFAFVTPAKAEKLAANTARPGDLIFTQRGTIGQVAIVPNGPYNRYIVSQSQMKLTPDDAKVDTLFLYYLFSTPAHQQYVRQHAIQTGVPHTNLGILRTTPLALPPLPEQRAIAAILGAFDDKIELNRRMNATLEALARALFKSWFVDFDPVRAKAEGRQPAGMDAETAALFPDCFEDSEIGEMPSSWQVTKIRDVADINRQSITGSYPHRHIDYVDISSVKEGRLEGTTAHHLTTAPSRARRLIQHGDTIWSTVRPNRKSYLYIHDPQPNLVVSTGFAVLMPRGIPSTYLYAWVTTNEFVDYLAYNADGSAYPAVRPGRFGAADILLPSTKVLDVFHKRIEPIRGRIAHNWRENKTLEATRDALLPKLISGQVSLGG